MSTKIFRVQGDTGPDVTFQQTGIDITGFTAEMRVQRQNGTRFSSTGVIVNAPTGDWRFPLTAANLAIAGEHELEFEINNSGDIATYPQDKPMTLVVREQKG